MLTNLLLVFTGGGIGAVCRYLVTTIIGNRVDSIFPYGTLVVNVIASYLIGFITFYFIAKNGSVPTEVRLFFAVGFLGGFSTLSSLTLETLNLVHSNVEIAVFNILLNVSLAMLAVVAGMLTANSIS